jgi:3-dehydroquinate dehydratase
MKKFKSMNGEIIERKIIDFMELKQEGYDIVSNCAGLGSSSLALDQLVVPVRGQVSRVNVHNCLLIFYIFF